MCYSVELLGTVVFSALIQLKFINLRTIKHCNNIMVPILERTYSVPGICKAWSSKCAFEPAQGACKLATDAIEPVLQGMLLNVFFEEHAKAWCKIMMKLM